GNERGHGQAIDNSNRICLQACRIKSYMTISVCNRHDKAEFLAAIKAREFLQPLAAQISMSEEALNSWQ
ncbi:870_t:CDS:1, partial [Gigaspora rosea]